MSSTSPSPPSTLDLDYDAVALDEGFDAPLESPGALIARGLEGNLKETADIAAATGLLATQALAKRVVMDAETMTTKQLIDVAEHSAKLSGLLKRQDDKQGPGAGFSIVINLPGGETTTMGASQGTVIDAGSTAPLDRLCGATIDFSDAPEF